MKNSKLYYQCINSFPLWTFCHSAALGAYNDGMEIHPYENLDDIESIRHKTGNIIVGSVETTAHYLRTNGFDVPKSIDLDLITNKDYLELLGRDVSIIKYEELKNTKYEYPFFIKPNGSIKAFSGFVVDSQKTINEIDFYLDGYKGEIQKQSILNFKSEWRVYVVNNQIIGIGIYKGDPKIFPDNNLIDEILNKKFFDISAYVFDIGVSENGSWLVEFNDGWAIENYGLTPDDYYKFVKTRFNQLTMK